MKLIKYKTVNNYQVAKAIEQRLELTAYQKSKLSDVIQSLPYHFIEFEKREKANILFRLSGLLYPIFYLLLLMFMPFKWLFTGYGYYKYESKTMVFLRAWNKKINF